MFNKDRDYCPCPMDWASQSANGFDWNRAKIDCHGGESVALTPAESPYQCQAHGDIKRVATLTGNLEEALSDWIGEADFVLCCFAWLTNSRVLNALAALRHGCQVVIQKEDFLRPDIGHTQRSDAALREKYDRLRCDMSRYEMPSIASELSVSWDDRVEPVRCAGTASNGRSRPQPRMHHKFAVACKVVLKNREGWPGGRAEISPYSVWTGSFNPTSNGTRSRENAVIIDSRSAAAYYAAEWSKVFALSEPLDWKYRWVAPEYRIGT